MKKRGHWRGAILYGLVTCLFGTTAQAEPADNTAPKWESHIGAEGKFGNRRSIGEGDLFVPAWQNEETLLFASMRGRFDDQSSREGNLGLGIRHMLPSGWNLGVYAYWDRRRTDLGNDFNQSTVGIEALGRDFDLRVNGYLPLGNRSGNAITTGGGSTAAIVANTVRITTAASTTTEERAIGGFDGEIGWRLPLFDANADTQFRLYAGGYRFADGSIKVTGPRARAEFAINQVPGMWRGTQLFIGAEAQHDSVRGSQQFASIRLSIPFGGSEKRVLSSQERRMTAPIIRDVDIVTGTRVTASTPAMVETATTSGGQAITVVNDTSAYGATLTDELTAAGANSTVILSGTFSTTATTTLQSGQTVMGGGSLAVKSASGHTATLSLPGGTVNATIGGVGAAASNPGFMMANNSTVDGLNISLTRSGGSGAFGVYVTNVSGATIRNSTITGRETGGNASEGVTVGNATSNITISNNTISAVGTAGQSAIAFIIANGGGGAAATVTGNTLSATGGGNNWAVVQNGGTFNAGSTGNVKSAGTCNVVAAGTGTLYFTDSTTCP